MVSWLTNDPHEALTCMYNYYLPNAPALTRPFINYLIDKLTNGTGEITITPSPSATSLFLGVTIPISLESLTIKGLDTFSSISLLQPSANTTLSTSLITEITLSHLTILARLKKKVLTKVTYHDLAITAANITLRIDLIAVINGTLLDSLYIQELYSTRHLGCLADTIHSLAIADISQTSDSFLCTLDGGPCTRTATATQTDIEGSYPPPTKTSEDGDRDMLDTLYMGTAMTRGTAKTPLVDAINAKIADTLTALLAQYPCLPHIPSTEEQVTSYIDWTEAKLLGVLDTVLNSAMGVQGVNTAIACLTNHTGTLTLAPSSSDKYAVQISNLDSFYQFSFLVPPANTSAPDPDPNTLLTTIGLGSCINTTSNTDCLPLKISIMDPTLLSLLAPSSPFGTGPGPILPPGWGAEMSLTNLTLTLDLILQLSKGVLGDLQVQQIGTKGCLASAASAVALSSLTASAAAGTLTLLSPNRDGTRDVSNGLDKILAFLSSPGLVTRINTNIAGILSDAPAICANGGVIPFSDDEVPSSLPGDGNSEVLTTWQIGLLAAAGGVLLAVSAMYYMYRRRKNKNLKNENNNMSNINMFSSNEYSLLGDVEGEGLGGKKGTHTRVWWGWYDEGAIVFNPHISLWLRVSYPVLIAGCFGVFLYSNLYPGAVSVLARITLSPGSGSGQGHSITTPPVFSFGLANTIQDMWDAEVYPLALLIAFFSGAWPYIKLALLALCWVAGPGTLPVTRRDGLLRFLDIFGKWSLIDFFVMVMMMCAFHFELTVTVPGSASVEVDVLVVPYAGFYTFLLATMVSLVLGHVAIAAHRHIAHVGSTAGHDSTVSSTVRSTSTSGTKESMYAHRFALPSAWNAYLNTSNSTVCVEDSDDSLDAGLLGPVPVSIPSGTDPEGAALTGPKGYYIQLTVLGGILLLCSIAAVGSLLVAGTFVDTLRFQFQGLTGLVLRGAADVDYSYVSVGQIAPKAAGGPEDDFFIQWMMASYFIFGLAMPLGCLLLLVVLWFCPLTLPTQRRLFVLTEVFNAWSALDVFCISIAAALLEIQQFAAFIVGDSCDGINVILAKYLDTQLDGDDKCFDVVATLLNDSYLIFLAAGTLFLLCVPSLCIVHHVIEEREHRSRSRDTLVHAHIHEHIHATNRDTCTDSGFRDYSVTAIDDKGVGAGDTDSASVQSSLRFSTASDLSLHVHLSQALGMGTGGAGTRSTGQGQGLEDGANANVTANAKVNVTVEDNYVLNDGNFVDINIRTKSCDTDTGTGVGTSTGTGIAVVDGVRYSSFGTMNMKGMGIGCGTPGSVSTPHPDPNPNPNVMSTGSWLLLRTVQAMQCTGIVTMHTYYYRDVQDL